MSLTLIIVIANVVASFYAWNNPEIMQKWMFDPYDVWHKKKYYRFITSGFIHADYIHLALNMFSLFSFGEVSESIFSQIFGKLGSLVFILFYLIALVASDIWVLFKEKNNYRYKSLGASGAVSAVIFFVIVYFPTSKISFYFIPMPAFVMGGLYLAYSYWMSKNQYDNISHEAHLAGAIFGLVAAIGIYPPVLLDFIQQISNSLY